MSSKVSLGMLKPRRLARLFLEMRKLLRARMRRGRALADLDLGAEHVEARDRAGVEAPAGVVQLLGQQLDGGLLDGDLLLGQQDVVIGDGHILHGVQHHGLVIQGGLLARQARHAQGREHAAALVKVLDQADLGDPVLVNAEMEAAGGAGGVGLGHIDEVGRDGEGVDVGGLEGLEVAGDAELGQGDGAGLDDDALGDLEVLFGAQDVGVLAEGQVQGVGQGERLGDELVGGGSVCVRGGDGRAGHPKQQQDQGRCRARRSWPGGGRGLGAGGGVPRRTRGRPRAALLSWADIHEHAPGARFVGAHQVHVHASPTPALPVRRR